MKILKLFTSVLNAKEIIGRLCEPVLCEKKETIFASL